MNKRILGKLAFFIVVALPLGYFLLVKLPQLRPADTANLTTASDTLSNSRLSYRAGVATGSSGSSTVTIDASGFADNDTDHLFPKDVLCFADANFSGCSVQATYTVANVIDSTTFNIASPLSAALGANDLAIATQSATHTILFTTSSVIPSNGDILITVPSIDITGKTNDGFPDSSSAVGTNGFDLNSVGTSDISVSEACSGVFTVAAVTAGTSSTDHTIRIDNATASCAASTAFTVTIGTGTNKLINPAPVSSGHTQGTADVYTVNVKTRDGGDNTLDQVDIKVAPIEAVFVSATVDETLSFSIAGTSPGTYCGQTTDITTTAMSVPWGTISTVNSFLEGAQTVTVSTNAPGGYSVKVEENDQMGKDGATCTGASASESSSPPCIKDTVCDATCSESASTEWTTATNNGLGFSLANSSGTDATFLFNESSRTFSSRQFADQEASETKQNIMYNANPVSGSAVNVCYRISVSATQDAGYYYNTVKYTATGIF